MVALFDTARMTCSTTLKRMRSTFQAPSTEDRLFTQMHPDPFECLRQMDGCFRAPGASS
jgi:hypothetical protein